MEYIEIPLDGNIIIRIPNLKPLHKALLTGKFYGALRRFERKAGITNYANELKKLI